MDASKYIDRIRDVNKDQEKEISMYKENNLFEEMTHLKVFPEETKRVEEVLRKQIQEKEKHCEKLESEIVELRRELEKRKA